MFFKIAGFEFRYQLRQPVFWVAFGLFGLFAFGSIASDNIRIGSTDNVHKNAAFVIAQTCLLLGVIYAMLVTPAFVANVIVRDDESGFGGIIRSTRISKFDYLYGRFVGALGVAALGYLAVPLGLLLGAAAPWVDAETLGPLVVGHYLYAYVVLALPILLLCGSLFFALTTVTRSMMWTYVGVIALLVLRAVLGIVLSKPGMEHIAAIWEPFGGGAFGEATRYWTASERNTLMPPIAGDLLLNKAIYLAFAAALLIAAYRLFSFQSPERSGRVRRAAAQAAQAVAPSAPPASAQTLTKPSFGAATAWAQLWARTRLDAGQVFKSPAYFVLLGLAAFLSVFNLWLATNVSDYGGAIFPVTRVMMQALAGAFNFFGLIIAVYYAGELVWRERERRTEEIIAASPVPDWMFVVPKTLAITLVLISTVLVGIAMAILIQAIKGYFNFELDKYLVWYVLPNAIDFVIIAALAIFVQALVPHKFVGWAVMVVYLIASLVLNGLGFEDNLYQYGFGVPTMPLSDMNGLGHYWIGAYWFRAYWSACALILLVLADGLWRRGTEARFMPRLRRLPVRLMGPSGVILGVALAAFAGCGSFIFYNTHILNPYRTTLEGEQWQADYEKTYLRYETLPQPKIASLKLDIQIWPHDDKVVTHGLYVIQNRSTAPIGVLHLRFPRDLSVDAVRIDGAHLQSDDARFNYRIYALDAPMQPGEFRNLAFTTTFQQQGFRNSGNLLQIMDNGTFVNDRDLRPFIGMDRNGALEDRTKRRKYGLPAELKQPQLGQSGADQFNGLTHDSDWVKADITVTTDTDQTPMAPGYRVSQVVANGRRTVHFVTDSPMLNFFSAQSARYAVASVPYKGVDVSVYYDPQHPWNVKRIQQVIETGLDYYQANFSPYQFRQMRLLEFPDPQGQFAQSFANTVPWSEGIFFIADNSDPQRVDMVTYVGAHELAHQWWAHQEIAADEQGGAMLSETLAQYSAGMIMKHMYGPEMMHKFLKFELDSYLRARGGAVKAELPLQRVEDQPYVYYRKGSLVMYRLQDQIGEDAVNRALRQLLHDYAFNGPPYPTSLDLVKDLRAQAPADKQQLITDLFEKITLYEVKASNAVASRRPDGKWNLTFTVDAKKLYADGQGRETPAPMNEIVDVGAFDIKPGDEGYGPGKVIATQKLAIHSGVQTVTLVVSRLPRFAGVDPFNELIDRNDEATLTEVVAR